MTAYAFSESVAGVASVTIRGAYFPIFKNIGAFTDFSVHGRLTSIAVIVFYGVAV